MSDWVVELKGLEKSYRVYRHPFYQMLGLLNAWWPPKTSYTENHALRGLDLNVQRGEKIGIIGRNGSGKSTLLKIVAGKIQPTRGECQVRGRVSELIELGTGFHPEFTGAENVFSSLANMGITGREAKYYFKAVVDFSELENYMNQPVRVYSTGMYMRLAFSVASCKHPELLLVDEVLSVGDAYFTYKCMERMKELSAESKTTILFVSHNLYSLSFLCDRLVWLDDGQVRSQGEAVDILNLYDLSIREEEERKIGSVNALSKSERPGSGLVRVSEVSLEDGEHQKKFRFKRGQALHIVMTYKTPNYRWCPNPVFNVGISRSDGLIATCALFKVTLRKNQGRLRLSFPKLLLNNGDYFVTILVYKQLDLEGRKNKFYMVDKDICDVHTRCYEFKVEGSFGIETTVFSHPFEVFHEDQDDVEVYNRV